MARRPRFDCVGSGAEIFPLPASCRRYQAFLWLMKEGEFWGFG
jgi:hypothetical protein